MIESNVQSNTVVILPESRKALELRSKEERNILIELNRKGQLSFDNLAKAVEAYRARYAPPK